MKTNEDFLAIKQYQQHYDKQLKTEDFIIFIHL